ncbi:MAG: acetate--CoA ligase [Leptolyngbya sp. PLA3]|nr:MAG: acetate--CoA ligase [Cyanobacteria bacterium CYA]MCE7967320.1 acetate--CoA ligase [Leptolyngbya sp. PL-A3]
MTTQQSSSGIQSVLQEQRRFEPPVAAEVGAPKWLVGSLDEYRAMHKRSLEDPEGFWGEMASELHWFKKWSRVLEWNAPDARWFVGGKTNTCYNCIDRHIESGHGNDTAIIWEGEPVGADGPEIRRISYAELKREVSRLANALKSLGVKKGDIVTIYMGMVPELAMACLACARIGAPHSVIFGGFSAQAIIDRVHDAKSKVIITGDGAWRRGKVVSLKDNVDAACDHLAGTPEEVQNVLVLKRCGNKINWKPQRDLWWHDVCGQQKDDCPCEQLDAEDMLFLLYTSGSTGKPKGIIHTTGGYSVFSYLTAKYAFNLIPDQKEPRRNGAQSGQVFWCTADVGWVTGHSYIIYGILTNRVPSFMFEGAPDFPAADRFWDIIERHKITQFYTAPTAIRAFMKWGDEQPAKHDLTSLQLIGSVGEPINPEAWMWYRRHIGRDVCPVVDTWWQTETGGQMIMPMPGATPTKPGSCTLPFFGVDAAIVDERGDEMPLGSGGLLAIRRPWPAMLRGVRGDRQRYIDTYWSKFEVEKNRPAGCPSPYYFCGDGAFRDTDGYFWILGRVDDVINVSGHRLGTMEVESALVSHPAVVEAAVVGMPHEIKGTGIAAFVTLANNVEPTDTLRKELREHVANEIGAIAKPDQIRFAAALPKTRSGKIMRRLLRSIAAGETNIKQDTTTLEDYAVVSSLQKDEG